jgi:integrase/recombinase XerD
MKPTDLSTHVTDFLTRYLAGQRNLSPNTIKAYRDVFVLLLRFSRDVRGVAVERLSLAQIDVPFVEAFLDHLANARHCSVRTQNQRLAALHSFFRYVQSEVPEQLLQCQKILAIPLQRQPQPSVGYLSKDQLVQVLAHPDTTTVQGRRDAVLLSVLYDTGARVQELIDLDAGDVRLTSPAQIRLMGSSPARGPQCIVDLVERRLARPRAAPGCSGAVVHMTWSMPLLQTKPPMSGPARSAQPSRFAKNSWHGTSDLS